ncbi:MAG: hypothetical protein WCP32_10305 [Bacteroidota bacterium]
MVIGFKEHFVVSILSGIKQHTIREDKHNRWKPGMLMHMATGVRTKNYYQFALETCTRVDKIEIFWAGTTIVIFISGMQICEFNTAGDFCNFGGNGYLNLFQLAIKDGFDGVDSFTKWFDKPFIGKIIYWW